MSKSDNPLFVAERSKALVEIEQIGPNGFESVEAEKFTDMCDAMAFSVLCAGAQFGYAFRGVAVASTMIELMMKEWCIRHPDQVKVWIGAK